MALKVISPPALMKIPPPFPALPVPSAFPLLTLRLLSVRLPPAATSRMRKASADARAMVEPLPLIVMLLVITGSPFAPLAPLLAAAVRGYVHPAASVMTGPPALLALLIAALSPALSPQATLMSARAT